MKYLINNLRQRRQRARSRKQLSALSDTQLRDIGVTFQQAKREARKGFWR